MSGSRVFKRIGVVVAVVAVAGIAVLAFYATLAELYIRLNYTEQAEAVLTQGLGFAKEGDKALFIVHSLLADVYDR